MIVFELNDRVFAPQIAADAAVTIPAVLEECRQTGRIAAFDLAWKPGAPNPPHIFFDSDVAKLLEGMCRIYEINRDARLRTEIDTLTHKIIAAQQPDGYLNTYYTQVEPEKRFTDLFDGHELYCAGHLIEAGIAHFRATGERTLLDAVCRYADYLNAEFGPRGRRRGCPGHEEIELALAQLFDVTGRQCYLDLARHFLDVRGVEPNSFASERTVSVEMLRNRQAHRPVREQHTAEGHAVRMLYLARGMAEVGLRTGDRTLLDACAAIARNIAEQRMYITGGVGSSATGKAFTVNGDLPDTSAYAESCGAIALAFFARTMLAATGERFYADLIERVLYNGAASGIDRSGRRFFYANLLASSEATVEHGWVFRQRREWFGCSCCPTSFTRYLPQLSSFCVQNPPGTLQIAIPAAGTVRQDQTELLQLRGNYPYEGSIRIEWRCASPLTLRLRIPKWCGKFRILRNRVETAAPLRDGWLELAGPWQAHDQIEMMLDMPFELVYPAARLAANRGMAALVRGPLVYCMETCDNPSWRFGAGAFSQVPDAAEFSPANLPAGTVGAEVAGWSDQRNPAGPLYGSTAPDWQPTRWKFIPYAFWQNRGAGEMAIYLPVR